MTLERPPAGVLIRPFRVTDQAAVRRLVLAGLAERWGHLDETLNPDLDNIAGSYVVTGGAVLVAEHGGVIVGTGTLKYDGAGVGQIVRMSVASDARRQGLARRLVLALLNAARAAGCERVIVETMHNWHSAVALYVACGFREYDRDAEDVYLALDFSGDDRQTPA